MRSCGDCTMCCKILGVQELEKPAGVWCSHCAIAQGCKIYQDRPQSCRDFECFWLQHPELADSLRPDKTKVVLWEVAVEDTDRLVASGLPQQTRVIANVDESRPDAWRWGEIHDLLVNLAADGVTVGISIGEKKFLLTTGESNESGVPGL